MVDKCFHIKQVSQNEEQSQSSAEYQSQQSVSDLLSPRTNQTAESASSSLNGSFVEEIHIEEIPQVHVNGQINVESNVQQGDQDDSFGVGSAYSTQESSIISEINTISSYVGDDIVEFVNDVNNSHEVQVEEDEQQPVLFMIQGLNLDLDQSIDSDIQWDQDQNIGSRSGTIDQERDYSLFKGRQVHNCRKIENKIQWFQHIIQPFCYKLTTKRSQRQRLLTLLTIIILMCQVFETIINQSSSCSYAAILVVWCKVLIYRKVNCNLIGAKGKKKKKVIQVREEFQEQKEDKSFLDDFDYYVDHEDPAFVNPPEGWIVNKDFQRNLMQCFTMAIHLVHKYRENPKLDLKDVNMELVTEASKLSQARNQGRQQRPLNQYDLADQMQQILMGQLKQYEIPEELDRYRYFRKVPGFPNNSYYMYNSDSHQKLFDMIQKQMKITCWSDKGQTADRENADIVVELTSEEYYHAFVRIPVEPQEDLKQKKKNKQQYGPELQKPLGGGLPANHFVVQIDPPTKKQPDQLIDPDKVKPQDQELKVSDPRVQKAIIDSIKDNSKTEQVVSKEPSVQSDKGVSKGPSDNKKSDKKSGSSNRLNCTTDSTAPKGKRIDFLEFDKLSEAHSFISNGSNDQSSTSYNLNSKYQCSTSSGRSVFANLKSIQHPTVFLVLSYELGMHEVTVAFDGSCVFKYYNATHCLVQSSDESMYYPIGKWNVDYAPVRQYGVQRAKIQLGVSSYLVQVLNNTYQGEMYTNRICIKNANFTELVTNKECNYLIDRKYLYYDQVMLQSLKTFIIANKSFNSANLEVIIEKYKQKFYGKTCPFIQKLDVVYDPYNENNHLILMSLLQAYKQISVQDKSIDQESQKPPQYSWLSKYLGKGIDLFGNPYKYRNDILQVDVHNGFGCKKRYRFETRNPIITPRAFIFRHNREGINVLLGMFQELNPDRILQHSPEAYQELESSAYRDQVYQNPHVDPDGKLKYNRVQCLYDQIQNQWNRRLITANVMLQMIFYFIVFVFKVVVVSYTYFYFVYVQTNVDDNYIIPSMYSIDGAQGNIGSRPSNRILRKVENFMVRCIHTVKTQHLNPVLVNGCIIQKFKLYSLEHDNQEVQFNTGIDVLEHYSKFCTCNTNKVKRKINQDVPQFMDNLQLSSYGNCPINAIGAILGRHGFTMLSYDQQIVNDFERFVRNGRYIEQIVEQVNLLTDQQKSWETYIKHVQETDPKKAIAYTKARLDLIRGYDLSHEYECFPKSGEWFATQIGTDYKRLSNRPRNIFNPPMWIKAIGGHYNYILLQAFKKAFPYYVGNLNMSQLEQHFDKEFKRFQYPKSVAIDGSSHDSHQHAALLRIVDVELIDQTFNQLYNHLNIPDFAKDDVYKMLSSTQSRIVSFYKEGKKRKRLYTCTVTGTVFSGHPTRTTLGNSMRVMLFNLYMFHLAGITHFSLSVGGDDTMILIEDQDLQAFRVAFHICYSPVPYGVHGLGQCARFMQVLPDNHIDFLSRVGIYTSNGTYIHRNVARVIFNQLYSDSPEAYKDIYAAQMYGLLAVGATIYNRDLAKKYQQMEVSKNMVKVLKEVLGYNERHIDLEQYINHLSSATSCLYQDNLYGDIIQQVGDSKGCDKFYYVDIKNCIQYTDNYVHMDLEYTGTKHLDALIGSLTNKNNISGELPQEKSVPESLEQDFQQSSQQSHILAHPANGQNTGLDSSHDLTPDQQYPILARGRTIVPDGLIGAKNGKNKVQMQKVYVQKPADKQIKAVQQQNTAIKKSVEQIKNQFYKQNKRPTYGPSTQSNTNKQQYQQQMSRKVNSFVASVLKPFDTIPIKPYFDYPLNTSMIEQTMEFQLAATTGSGTNPIGAGQYGVAVTIFPHAYNDLKINDGALYRPSGNSGNIRFFTQFITGSGDPADVKANAPSPLQAPDILVGTPGVQTPQPSYYGVNNSISGRWMSARVVRCGIRLIPTSAQISRAGLIQIVQVPGKDRDLIMSGESTFVNIPFPSTTQIKNYATSYEASNASNIRQHDYAWVPTDVQDSIFMQDQMSTNNSGANLVNFSGDPDTLSNHLRNGIYILATGLAATDTFRLEVKITYEFVPTMSYKQWTDTNGPRALLADQQKLKDVIVANPLAQSVQEGCDLGSFLFNTGKKLISSQFGGNLMQELATAAWRQVSSTKF